MTYRYDEPIRAEDDVLFRVHDHALRSFLFKVDKPVLEALYVADIGPRNPIDPADRGYPSQHLFRHVDDDRPFDSVDAYNHHRELIHRAAVTLIESRACRPMDEEPAAITRQMLQASAA
jgi:hypothetical protein